MTSFFEKKSSQDLHITSTCWPPMFFFFLQLELRNLIAGVDTDHSLGAVVKSTEAWFLWGASCEGLEAFLFVDEGGEKVEVVIASWY